jgi:hypothetical protein
VVDSLYSKKNDASEFDAVIYDCRHMLLSTSLVN